MPSKNPAWLVWALTGTILVGALVVAGYWPAVANDSINRFAPMAEAFAVGNWQEAFHPRFGILFQALTGSLTWSFGVPGNISCSMMALLGWALCLPVIYSLAARLFDSRVAWAAAIVYLLLPEPFYWALRGMRESYRLLGTLLMIDGVVRCGRKEPLAGVIAGLGVFVLCTLRTDTILQAILIGLCFAVCDRLRWRTWLLVAWGVLTLQPSCWLVWKWTGYWLPALQYIDICKHWC